MLAPHLPNQQVSAITHLHTAFLALLPRIELHGRVYFRHLKCPLKKEEAIAEMVALAWKWFVRLVQRDKDPTRFISALADYAARAVNSGRRVCGQERANDVLSPVAQQKRGFHVTPLPDSSSLYGNVFDEALHDNTRTPVPDQVAFRQDFPAWRRTRSERDRRVVDELMVGEGTLAVARRHGLSPGRISQLRQEFHSDWQRFHGEPNSAAV